MVLKSKATKGLVFRLRQLVLLAIQEPIGLDRAELHDYQLLVEGGDIYQILADKCDVKREKAKKRFLVDVLAKKRRYPSEIEKAFADIFPGIYSLIRTINRDCHCTLIRLLQGLEAEIIVHTIAADCVNHFPTVTLHDAICVPASRVGDAEDRFRLVQEELGIGLRWNKKQWITQMEN